MAQAPAGARRAFKQADPCGMLPGAHAGFGLTFMRDRRRPAAPGPGGVAEWSKALVLKTSEPKGSVGSNPTPTAIIGQESHRERLKED